MRFNSRELAVVVQQTTHYDKEGYLFMKEKQEGFFKKSEAYVSRYIRLKGNLLFYFKNKDSKADPLGVIVLERCAVELAVDDDISSGFLLVFEGEDQAFHFGATAETERDEWIQALHIASHECLKMQLQSLREQLQTKTGNDLVHMPVEQNSTVDFESQSDNTSQDPVLEISVACCNLPNDSSDVPPNALLVVHTMLPPQQQIWMHHNHTEIVEKSNNPQFLKTIGFGDKFGIDTATKVRLTVYHVVERMTGTMTQVGQAIFTLQDLLMNNDLSLTLTLRTHDLKDKGSITVTSWINDERVSLNELQTQQSGTYSKRPRTFSLGRHSHNLQAHFNDIIKRSFRFATNDEKSMIQVSEYMAESKWTFEIPIQLLRLWINEEKHMISLLQDLGELPFDQGYVRQETSDYCMSMVVSYSQHAAHLLEYTGVTFKRSADRGKQELEFVPVNLHVERMVVSSDHSPSGKVYDLSTVGAFSTHCRDLKNGGLKRLLHNARSSSYAPDESSQPRAKMQQACQILNEVTELRTQLRGQCEKMLLAAELEKTESVSSGIASMKEKVARLNSLCAEPLVVSAAESYLSAKRNTNTSEGSDSSSLKNVSEHEDSSTEHDRKSSSISGFTKSSPMEPWEVTRLNMEAAFVCLVSVVEDLTRQKTQDKMDLLVDIDVPADETGPRLMLHDIKPALTKMQGFMDIVCSRLSLFLTFLAVMENKGQIRTVNDLKIRRDIVNAHAITTLVSAIAALTLTDQIVNPQFTEQLCSVGLLFQLEGLISCYGSELCMLEDTIVGVDDLNHVTFRLVLSSDKDFTPKVSTGSFVREGPYPDINRHNIIIEMPVEKDVFSRLPKDLQQGKQIKVTALAFNIGINEQATLAEKFGSTALQERLNMESFAKLYEYYTHYSKYFDDPLDKSQGLGSLSHMIKMLQNNVMTKKSKNVEVLHVASAVTRALKGLRTTFCKSGKDRTAMAVTLEMVHILQRHHNLASHVFIQSLDCLRSVGCRRDNTLKNTGVKKYAFISLQMLYIPKLYRAPSGVPRHLGRYSPITEVPNRAGSAQEPFRINPDRYSVDDMPSNVIGRARTRTITFIAHG